jgi:hypothetical protein
MENAELRYSMETAREVRGAIVIGDLGASTAVRGALLLHYASLDPSRYWARFLYPILDPTGAAVEANLAMASVSILAMAALPLNKHNFQSIDYSWIGRGEITQLTKVSSTLGLSRMMLHFIWTVTQEAKVCSPS